MLKDFDFELPNELIAEYPRERGKARLMCWSSEPQEMVFEDIHKLLQPGDVLVLNDSRVIPSCLYGEINNERIRINLTNRLDGFANETWEVLSKPRKKLLLNSKVIFSDKLHGRVIEKFNDNNMDVIEFNLSGDEFYRELDKVGSMPLPPYIKRPPDENDKTSYQTVFSKVNGSVAAPTAGLHFSNELLEIIKSKGVKVVYVTLHVGSGTFLPVRTENISEHKMHREFYSIDQSACDAVNDAKSNGKRVIAVGTTAIRTLESAAKFCGEKTIFPHTNHTNLFITLGYDFKVVDCLVTNFHLPKSTLFILVCAFLGSIDSGQKLYRNAIDRRFRFFSYGDACFLIR